MVKVLSFKVPNLTEANKRTAQQLRNLTAPGSRLHQFAQGDDQAIQEQLERPVLRQFEEQTLPGISQQYTGSGLLGSSAYANAVASAQGRLQENLVANRENVRSRAFNQLLQADQLLFANPDYRYKHVVRNRRSFFQRLLGIGANIALGAVTGGIGGAITGGLAGIAGGIGRGIAGAGAGGAAGLFNSASPFTALPDTYPGQGVTNFSVPQAPSPPSAPTSSSTLQAFEDVAAGTTPVTGGGERALQENDPQSIERRKAFSGRQAPRNRLLPLLGV